MVHPLYVPQDTCFATAKGPLISSLLVFSLVHKSKQPLSRSHGSVSLCVIFISYGKSITMNKALILCYLNNYPNASTSLWSILSGNALHKCFTLMLQLWRTKSGSDIRLLGSRQKEPLRHMYNTSRLASNERAHTGGVLASYKRIYIPCCCFQSEATRRDLRVTTGQMHIDLNWIEWLLAGPKS